MGSETPTGALTFEFGLLCLNTNVGEATDVRLSSMRGCSKGRAKGFRRHIKTFAKQNSTSSMTMCMKSVVPAGAQQTTKHHWNDVETNVRENTKEIHGLKPNVSAYTGTQTRWIKETQN